MMHDHSRNKAYDKAIEWTLQHEYKENDVTVFDIGAGMGLLSMMAASHGAAHVVAIEHSAKLADLAHTVISSNNFNDIIKIHQGDIFDLHDVPLSIRPEEPRIIVHELFAQHMLCELCHQIIPTARNLIHPVRVIPSSATTYAVLVDSNYLSYGISSLHPNDSNATTSNVLGFDLSSVQNNFDQGHLIGTQVLPLDDLIQLSDPVPIISTRFDTGMPSYVEEEALRQSLEFKLIRNGTARAILIYWTAEMVPGINLSTSPFLETPTRARWAGWPAVMQDILKKTIVKGENEWDGKVVTGDIVGATWNHYWPKGFDWASELIQKNESRKNQGCAVKVKMGSHNGKIFSRTNRIPMVIYYPMVEYINYDGSREVKRLNVEVE